MISGGLLKIYFGVVVSLLKNGLIIVENALAKHGQGGLFMVPCETWLDRMSMVPPQSIAELAGKAPLTVLRESLIHAFVLWNASVDPQWVIFASFFHELCEAHYDV